MKNRLFMYQRKRSRRLHDQIRHNQCKIPYRARMLRYNPDRELSPYSSQGVVPWRYKNVSNRAERLGTVLSYPPGEALSWGDISPREMLWEILARARCNIPGAFNVFW